MLVSHYLFPPSFALAASASAFAFSAAFLSSAITQPLACLISKLSCFLAGQDPSSRRYAANFAAGGLTGIVQDYVTREACSAEELGRLLETMFSGALFL